MTEVSFYHLLVQPLEEVLPNLVERSLDRGWRALIVSPDDTRLSSLDTLLWSYRDESFLPHGMADGPNSADQPILLAAETNNANNSQVCFLLDDADFPAETNFERIVYLFDGNNEADVVAARQRWKDLKSTSQKLAYWRQNELAKWQQVS